MAELQEESEQLIARVEAAMGRMRAEHDGANREHAETKRLLEEAGDSVFDLQAEEKALRAQLREAERALQGEVEAAEQRAEQAEREAREKAQRDASGAAERLAAAEAEAQRRANEAAAEEERMRGLCGEMHGVLVNHKREVLMQHKVESEVLQSDLQLLLEQTDEVEAVKGRLQDETALTEEQVVELEEQIRQHGKTSAIKDGRVNPAHKAKRARLDEEYEALLEQVEEKRTKMQGVEEKLAELTEQRQDKEDDMKDLERSLVQVMVEQQKKLLKLLTGAGGVGIAAQTARSEAGTAR